MVDITRQQNHSAIGTDHKITRFVHEELDGSLSGIPRYYEAMILGAHARVKHDMKLTPDKTKLLEYDKSMITAMIANRHHILTNEDFNNSGSVISNMLVEREEK